MKCRLCGEEASLFWEQFSGINWETYGRPTRVGEGLKFFRCHRCGLIFKDPEVFPGEEAERAVYLNHQNSLEDEGYRNFLRRVMDPVMESWGASSPRILDYGSGPTPVLQMMFREAGLGCAGYDPYFCPELSVLSSHYDVITCTEVIEHIYDPAPVFALFEDLLEPGGEIYIMTQPPPLRPAEFSTWWYHRDPSHVAFYGPDVFRWIAKHHNWEYLALSPGVSLFRKPMAPR